MSAESRWPEPSLVLTRREARRFLLAHQRLWPPRRLRGKAGILEYLERVRAIQFDPINVVGRNPDLVLQSRVRGYRPRLLEELLYRDRRLVDGWDKMASVLLARDWPHFARFRRRMRRKHGSRSNPQMAAAPQVLEAIRGRGPLSSIDFKQQERVDGDWGVPTTAARAALELLYAMGELVVDHRVGSRRSFDLAERLLPRELLEAPDPIEADSDHQRWHVLRRLGGLGLAGPAASDMWLAIHRVKSKQRRAILQGLVKSGDLAVVAVEGLGGETLFMRQADFATLEAIRGGRAPRAQAAFLAPLDNLMWDRGLLSRIFDFDYTWEVYKPAKQRQYGYYVLPVLYRDRFVARFDPKFDRTSGELTVANWWWERGMQVDEVAQAALARCLGDFARYLEARRIRLGPVPSRDPRLGWAREVARAWGRSRAGSGKRR